MMKRLILQLGDYKFVSIIYIMITVMDYEGKGEIRIFGRHVVMKLQLIQCGS